MKTGRPNQVRARVAEAFARKPEMTMTDIFHATKGGKNNVTRAVKDLIEMDLIHVVDRPDGIAIYGRK